MTKKLLSILGVLALGLGGCASLDSAPPAEYVCADGRSFLFKEKGGFAQIDISAISFPLQAEPAPAGESRYSCSMLNVRFSGDIARVEMEGKPYLEQCRRQR